MTLLAALAGCDQKTDAGKAATTLPPQAALPAPPAATHIGGKHCQGCHQNEYSDWHGSHHDLAMQEVSRESVLGNFDNATFDYAGTTTRFSRKDDQFLIRTDGPDGSLAEYPVAYVFGVYPLQQYLLALPGGRLQALSIAWDSRPAAEGGQRWFHLYPDDQVQHDDPLHWTRHSQNWNFMCAECHSTRLDKNYQPATETYDTSWSEIDVSCEACHGPASNHLLWANESTRSQYRFDKNRGLTHLFNEREGVHWRINSSSGQPERNQPRTTETEIQVCAACHSRRSQLSEDDRRGQPLLESFLPSTLDASLYHSDGQADAEVYVYGSFLQSKMYHTGVTCSDCHNPHSLGLRAPGDGVCLQCHTAEYTTPQHHHHGNQATAPLCIDCHMPSKNFMVVDARREHSFRIPRPDLSVSLNVPNTCNACHDDQSAQWAADQIRRWYDKPNPGFQQLADTFAAARAGKIEAKQPLQRLASDATQPAIVRATAARLLQGFLDQESIGTLNDCLSSADPLIRLSAAQALEGVPPQMRWGLLQRLLDDPTRVVRSVAAGLLADIPRDQLAAEDRQRLESATKEYLASQQFNADTPQSQLNLGVYHLQQGNADAALGHYRKAIAIDDSWLPAYANLADLHRQLGQDDQGRAVLEETLKRFPDAAVLHFSLGLLLVRQQDLPTALTHLQRAAELTPEDAHYSFVYAVGLQSAGRLQEALRVTQSALRLHPSSNLLALQSELEKALKQ